MTDPIARADALARDRLRELRRRYQELWSRHRSLVRQASTAAAERAGMILLATFALNGCDTACAIADADHVLFRNHAWQALERDLCPWRATARDPAAPATAPILLLLAVRAAGAMTGRGAPRSLVGRYERPDRGDVFDVRFEAIPGRKVIGISVRDVTRLVGAERELALAKRALDELRREHRGVVPGGGGALRGGEIAPAG